MHRFPNPPVFQFPTIAKVQFIKYGGRLKINIKLAYLPKNIYRLFLGFIVFSISLIPIFLIHRLYQLEMQAQLFSENMD